MEAVSPLEKAIPLYKSWPSASCRFPDQLLYVRVAVAHALAAPLPAWRKVTSLQNPRWTEPV